MTASVTVLAYSERLRSLTDRLRVARLGDMLGYFFKADGDQKLAMVTAFWSYLTCGLRPPWIIGRHAFGLFFTYSWRLLVAKIWKPVAGYVAVVYSRLNPVTREWTRLGSTTDRAELLEY